jgi:pilus assembly protein CpaB
MDRRKVILLMGALLVAGITALFARTVVSRAAVPQANATVITAPPPEPSPEILVATRTLTVGTIIDPTALKFQPWPRDMVNGAYFVKGQTQLAQLQGTVLRYAVPAGQPLTQAAIVKPGDRGFLAAALSPGMRAVTVPVSAQTAVAGFVFPGDRIDMVLTQDVAGGGDGPPLKASETIMRNVRVLATDQRTDTQSEDGKTPVRTFTTVTVEATPKMAEQLAVAQTVGTLSLSLRALADHSVTGDQPPEQTRPMVDHASYATGGDVSRYQRRNVPGRRADGGSGSGAGMGMGIPAPPAAPGMPAGVTGPFVRVARGSNSIVAPVAGTSSVPPVVGRN